MSTEDRAALWMIHKERACESDQCIYCKRQRFKLQRFNDPDKPTNVYSPESDQRPDARSSTALA